MIKFLIHRIVAWAAGLRAKDFKTILDWVVTANDMLQTSDDKSAWVTKLIRSQWPNVPNWAVNLLRELAVSFIKKP